jgi:hypothetical protein
VVKSISIIFGGLAVIALLLVYLLGPGQGAESSPGAGEVTGMPKLENGIPPIDAHRPTVTETAAFALG